MRIEFLRGKNFCMDLRLPASSGDVINKNLKVSLLVVNEAIALTEPRIIP